MKDKLYRLVVPKFRDPVDADPIRHSDTESLVAVAEVPSLDGSPTPDVVSIVKDFYDWECTEPCYTWVWDDGFLSMNGDPKDSKNECIDDFHKHYREVRTAGFEEVTP